MVPRRSRQACCTVASGRSSLKRDATLEDVANNRPSEFAALHCSSGFQTSTLSSCCSSSRGESQDEVSRLSHGGQERIPLDDAQFPPLARGNWFDPAN